jgi:hypothetical protein
LEDYKKRSTQKTKAGGAMSMMAHMELALKHKLNVNLGDVIYYVNNGIKASHGDVQKISKPTKKQKEEYLLEHGKEMPDGFVQINCYMLDQKTIEENPTMTGDYNVTRAVSVFNKRIEPLLICFGREIRNELLVEDPKDRALFTSNQCELINGVPFEPEDQDSIQDLLNITEAELKFWEKRGISPNYIYDLAEPGWENFM